MKKSPKSPIFILSFLVLSFFHSLLSAQTTLQVVTKNVEKSFAFSETKKVQIQAERADVEVSTWGRSEIKIMIELTAKHPDRAVAVNDLGNFKYDTETTGGTLYVRNYVLLTKSAAKPQANLKARYRLFLPAACALHIQNSFGKVEVEGLDKEIQLKTEFCSVILQNISGKITLDAHFGTLQADNLNGKFSLTTDRSDCQLKNIKGTCRIRADYGSIDIDTDKTLVKMDVKANQTNLKYSPTFTAKPQ